MSIFDEIMASRGELPEGPKQGGSALDQIMESRKQQQPLETKRAVGGEVDDMPSMPPQTGTSGIGAVAGSLLGEGVSMLPGVPKNVATIEGLAATGAFGGDITESLLRQAFAGQIPTIGEKELTSAGTEAGAALAGGLGVRALFKGFQKTGQYFSNSVTPEARDAINFLQQYKPDTSFFTAAEMTENRVLDLAQNAAEHSIWGGGDIRKFALNRDEVLSEISRDIAQTIGSYKDNISIGKMVLGIRKASKDIESIPLNNQYKAIEQEAKKLNINTALHGLKKWARPYAEENVSIGRFGQDLTGKGLAEKIMKMPDDMNVGDVMALQRAVRAKKRSLEKSLDKSESPAITFFSHAEKELDKIIEKGLQQKGAPADLYLLKKDTDRKWATRTDKFSNEVIKGLVKDLSKDPSSISKHLVTGGEGTEQLITALNRIMPKQARQVYQRGSLEAIYKASGDPVTGKISGKDMLKMLEGKTGMGERAGRALWGPEGYNSVYHFAKSLAEVQKKSPISEGSLAIQFVQFGALLAVATGNLGGEAAPVLLGPKVLAKILTNPKVEQSLLRGASMTKTDPRWPATLARITSVASVGQAQKDKEEQDLSLGDLIKGDPAMNPLLQGAY